MNGLIRVVGYLGLVFLLGGIATLVVISQWVPESRFIAVRGPMSTAAAAGYVLIVLRLGHLAATATGRERWLSRLGLVIAFVGVIAVVGVGMILITGGPAGG